MIRSITNSEVLMHYIDNEIHVSNCNAVSWVFIVHHAPQVKLSVKWILLSFCNSIIHNSTKITEVSLSGSVPRIEEISS